MDIDAVITLIVLGATVIALVFEWLPLGLTALLAPLVLVLVGILQPGEMWSGLSHPAVVAVAAMFVVSVGISRTGALNFLGTSLTEIARLGPRHIILVMMIGVALISAFTNNTTVVLVGIPIVLAMCDKLDQPPSRYLIPLSFAAIFGGMMTLIGTSTNIVVAEVGRRSVTDMMGDADFTLTMWDFTAMGSVFVVVGVAYMVLIGWKLLPDRVALSMTLSRDNLTEYVTEAEVTPESTLLGKSLQEVAEKNNIQVLQLIRNDVIEIPSPQETLRAGDILLLKGAPSEIVNLGHTGAELLPEAESSDLKTRGVDMTLAEVIVPPSSRWIGRMVSDIGFRSRYGVSVIAVQRHGHHTRDSVGNLAVEPADMLLVQGTVESLRNLRASENLILVEGVDSQVAKQRKAPVALWTLLGFVILVSTGVLDLATAAVVAAAAMVLFRCITLQQAFSAFDWNILFLLAGFLALGTALTKVGLANDIAEEMMVFMKQTPPWLLFGLLYLITAFLSDILTNAAVAALMVPIVVQGAVLMQISPRPMLMTVAFAASAAFLTPVGYQTNLLVYGPGGYRFRDFIKVGLPLRFIFAILAAVLIPYFYPLTLS